MKIKILLILLIVSMTILAAVKAADIEVELTQDCDLVIRDKNGDKILDEDVVDVWSINRTQCDTEFKETLDIDPDSLDEELEEMVTQCSNFLIANKELPNQYATCRENMATFKERETFCLEEKNDFRVSAETAEGDLQRVKDERDSCTKELTDLEIESRGSMSDAERLEEEVKDLKADKEELKEELDSKEQNQLIFYGFLIILGGGLVILYQHVQGNKNPRKDLSTVQKVDVSPDFIQNIKNAVSNQQSYTQQSDHPHIEALRRATEQQNQRPGFSPRDKFGGGDS